ncbi:hypothetical protein OG824_28065 [Streptomyces prunicolor]|uniref:hypothetical protein n=1 Tax=Streptomyces prunicolor TaxID=67348 RepID=UPI002251292F|nr:hypothetical protein [Streptomyces prunicolor]MCX5239060.1 hypothetical protein [Streptomyces prunicolor]
MQHTTPKAFALRLFTRPVKDHVRTPAPGEHFDRRKQVTVLADSTPRALTAYDPSSTCGGMTTSREYEILDAFPVGAGAASLTW